MHKRIYCLSDLIVHVLSESWIPRLPKQGSNKEFKTFIRKCCHSVLPLVPCHIKKKGGGENFSSILRTVVSFFAAVVLYSQCCLTLCVCARTRVQCGKALCCPTKNRKQVGGRDYFEVSSFSSAPLQFSCMMMEQ